VQIVAGISLKSLEPLVWDDKSSYYISQLQAIMVSYAEFHELPKRRQAAMEHGLHQYLNIPSSMHIYLDNGAFYFLTHTGETPRQDYVEFSDRAMPNWKPIPQDYIPAPQMSYKEQKRCFSRTVQVNYAYEHDGYVPVIHVGQFLERYCSTILMNERVSQKEKLSLGGIVPNLLRTPKAMPYKSILDSILKVRLLFADKQIHVFGVGGTATLHLMALLGIDSVDSSGWRNRAARGMIQLPGSGERVLADLGSWRGRRLSTKERQALEMCQCPACRASGIDGLTAPKVVGFRNRAAHNLWVLVEEARLIEEHLNDGTYISWYKEHLDNTIYRPLIDYAVTISPRLTRSSDARLILPMSSPM